MEDSPELVKLLKYILFGYLVLLQVPCSSSLVSEAPSHPQSHPHPYSDDFPASLENRGSDHHQNGPHGPYKRANNELDQEEMMRMMDRSDHNDRSDRGSGMRPILEKFGGSLCSIFKTFLEPRRRFQRCRVGPPPPGPPRNRRRLLRGGGGPGRRPNRRPSLSPLGSNDLIQDNEMMAMIQHHQQQQQQNQHDMEMRMMPMMAMNGGGGMQQQQQQQPHPHPGMMMGSGMSGKRYDENFHGGHPHLDEEQINNSGEEVDVDHHRHRSSSEDGIEGDRGDPHHEDEQEDGMVDPTKISQDRTMILVPERGCPPGQRRDARGYCRRLVKIRTNYQYGPPPPPNRASHSSNGNNGNGNLRPIPIRYYYSRIVTIPAFQFFYPNVRV